MWEQAALATISSFNHEGGGSGSGGDECSEDAGSDASDVGLEGEHADNAAITATASRMHAAHRQLQHKRSVAKSSSSSSQAATKASKCRKKRNRSVISSGEEDSGAAEVEETMAWLYQQYERPNQELYDLLESMGVSSFRRFPTSLAPPPPPTDST